MVVLSGCGAGSCFGLGTGGASAGTGVFCFFNEGINFYAFLAPFEMTSFMSKKLLVLLYEARAAFNCPTPTNILAMSNSSCP